MNADAGDIGGAAPGFLLLEPTDPDGAAFPGMFGDAGGPGLPPDLQTPLPFDDLDVLTDARLTFFAPFGNGRGIPAELQIVEFEVDAISEAPFVERGPIYRVDLAGTVIGFEGSPANLSKLQAEFAIGEAVTGRFTYDSTTPPSISSAELNQYNGVIENFVFTVGDYTLSPERLGANGLANFTTSGLPRDVVSYSIEADGPPVDDLEASSVGLILWDTSDSTFPGTDAPVLSDPLDLSGFDFTDFAAINFDPPFTPPLGAALRGIDEEDDARVLYAVDSIAVTLVSDDAGTLCTADLEGDFDVGLDDFSIFIAQFGNTDAECAP